ncbi:hypothetical protein [Formosa sp. S-31]|uniref:hypothetical protein n=1 Tax=Formosa sp. S-31 TaxID=2790949 RepID=UPI003EB9B621
MNEHIQYYISEFENQKQIIKKEIKSKLIEHKNNFLSFDNAHNSILTDFETTKNNLKVKKDNFSSLFLIFQNRYAFYEEEHVLEVIPRKLLPAFEQLLITKKYSFNDILKDIATHEAIVLIVNIFRKYSPIHRMEYSLNKLEELEILNYNLVPENIPRFNELHKLLYNSNESKIDDKRSPLNFEIKSEYSDSFKKLYFHFTELYLNEDFTSQDDFENIFIHDYQLKNSEIHFKCSTKLASQLLYRLSNEIFNKMNLAKIERSKKFKSQTDKFITGNNISNSKKQCSEDEWEMVEDTLNRIKKVKKP